MTQIFISKPKEDVPQLVTFCEQHGHDLIAESLIAFESVPAIIPDEFEFIFFTSPRSVHFFFEQAPHNLKCKGFACMGIGTEKALKEKGFEAAFVGRFSSDPENIFKSLYTYIDKGLVTVPHASTSLFSIQKFLPINQLKFIEVYKTIPVYKQIQPASIYIFTSPSNVLSFLESNHLAPEATVIAWGQSTKKILISKGIIVTTTLLTAQESELIGALNLC
jgi:uroporphyrinogen-III synthase